MSYADDQTLSSTLEHFRGAIDEIQSANHKLLLPCLGCIYCQSITLLEKKAAKFVYSKSRVLIQSQY